MPGPYLISESIYRDLKEMKARSKGEPRTHNDPTEKRDNKARLPAVRFGKTTEDHPAATFNGPDLTQAGLGETKFQRILADGTGIHATEPEPTKTINVLPRPIPKNTAVICLRDQTLEGDVPNAAAEGYIPLIFPEGTGLQWFELYDNLAPGGTAQSFKLKWEGNDLVHDGADFITVRDVYTDPGQFQGYQGYRGISVPVTVPAAGGNPAQTIYLIVWMEHIAQWIDFTLITPNLLGQGLANVTESYAGKTPPSPIPVHDAQGLFPLAVSGSKGKAAWDFLRERYKIVHCDQHWIFMKCQAYRDFTAGQDPLVKPGTAEAMTFAPHGSTVALPDSLINSDFLKLTGKENDWLWGMFDAPRGEWVLVNVRPRAVESTTFLARARSVNAFGPSIAMVVDPQTDGLVFGGIFEEAVPLENGFFEPVAGTNQNPPAIPVDADNPLWLEGTEGTDLLIAYNAVTQRWFIVQAETAPPFIFEGRLSQELTADMGTVEVQGLAFGFERIGRVPPSDIANSLRDQMTVTNPYKLASHRYAPCIFYLSSSNPLIWTLLQVEQEPKGDTVAMALHMDFPAGVDLNDVSSIEFEPRFFNTNDDPDETHFHVFDRSLILKKAGCYEIGYTVNLTVDSSGKSSTLGWDGEIEIDEVPTTINICDATYAFARMNASIRELGNLLDGTLSTLGLEARCDINGSDNASGQTIVEVQSDNNGPIPRSFRLELTNILKTWQSLPQWPDAFMAISGDAVLWARYLGPTPLQFNQ